METLFDKLPNATDLLAKRNENKEKLIAEQTEIVMKEIDKLTTEERIILEFPILDELRNALYRKGYNIIVNGNESILSIRDPKEDMDDEWTTFDCGN
ncbi:hypothetical protein ACQPU1_10150 [Clostridium paraputrificum]|uniref:hypothetical protein n=1 Tax=Clostridium TaxID=1485 RepID=UPI003D336274